MPLVIRNGLHAIRHQRYTVTDSANSRAFGSRMPPLAGSTVGLLTVLVSSVSTVLVSLALWQHLSSADLNAVCFSSGPPPVALPTVTALYRSADLPEIPHHTPAWGGYVRLALHARYRRMPLTGSPPPLRAGSTLYRRTTSHLPSWSPGAHGPGTRTDPGAVSRGPSHLRATSERRLSSR